tara:strand:- start:2035 stop:3177 length:1143 start_codon:yes stop_codon:yes gene_type:complete
MPTNDKDPIAAAKSILESSSKKKEMEEGLKDALESALKDGKAEFSYEGKKYKVEEDSAEPVEEAAVEDITGKLGGDAVPAPSVDAAEKNPKGKMKHDKNKPSDASPKIDTLKGSNESVEVDVDGIVDNFVAEESDEDMAALFSGEELTESFKDKAKTIFEIAVKARAKAVAGQIQEDANRQVSEITESIREEMIESMNDYLSYVTEEWMRENQIAIDRGIKSDISESFMMGLKSLFEAHYIDMPDEKYDMVAEMQAKLTDLEGQLNEQIQKNVELNSSLTGSQCNDIFNEVSKGLTDTQVEKLGKLAEGLEADTPQQFSEKLSILKESYFNNKVTSTNTAGDTEMLVEDTDVEREDQVFRTREMQNYASYMKRSAKNFKL